jgi:hypothetical protein
MKLRLKCDACGTEAVAEHFLEVVQQDLKLSGKHVVVSMSVGFLDHAWPPPDLCRGCWTQAIQAAIHQVAASPKATHQLGMT